MATTTKFNVSSKAFSAYTKAREAWLKWNENLKGFYAKHGYLMDETTGEQLFWKNKGKKRGYELQPKSVKTQSAAKRSAKEGYNAVRQELIEAGIDPQEIEEFIKQDRPKYQAIQDEIKRANAVSIDEIQKGHVKSLAAGGPDVSANIRPETRAYNASTKGMSPIDEALVAQGRPRNAVDAFLQWKHPEGTPKVTDFTYEQRGRLEAAKTSEEVDDLLNEFGAQNKKPPRAIDQLNLSRQEQDILSKLDVEKKADLLSQIKQARAKNIPLKTQLAAAGLAGFSWLGTAASAAETGIRGKEAYDAFQEGNIMKGLADAGQTFLSGVSTAADLVPVAGELVSTPADALNIAFDKARNDPSPEGYIPDLPNLK